MKPIRSVAVATVALALLAACGDDDPSATPSTTPTTGETASAAPTLSILAPAAGTAVKGKRRRPRRGEHGPDDREGRR